MDVGLIGIVAAGACVVIAQIVVLTSTGLLPQPAKLLGDQLLNSTFRPLLYGFLLCFVIVPFLPGRLGPAVANFVLAVAFAFRGRRLAEELNPEIFGRRYRVIVLCCFTIEIVGLTSIGAVLIGKHFTS